VNELRQADDSLPQFPSERPALLPVDSPSQLKRR